MKYYVRTTLERELDQTYNQIDYSLIIDKEHRPIDSFINALYLINDDDSVLLEDDLILCKDFECHIKEAIQKYPNRIINFFQSPFIYKETEESERIEYNQCTFYPKDITGRIAKEMEVVPRATKFPQCNQYSLVENEALKKLGLKVVQYRPHLVQHLDKDTFLFKETYGLRRSYFFIDYLDEIGIDYSQAYEKRHALAQCMSRHFANIDKVKCTMM